MRKEANRSSAIKTIISSRGVSSQEEPLQELGQEGFGLTQATLSRDLRQLKAAKAASMSGKYVYVLSSDIMYKQVGGQSADEMLAGNGLISFQFSGDITVIKTHPGYAGSTAYGIDSRGSDTILGTIARDDTIMLALYKGVTPTAIRGFLLLTIPDIG